jgi:hypothetical protein
MRRIESRDEKDGMRAWGLSTSGSKLISQNFKTLIQEQGFLDFGRQLEECQKRD